MNQQHNRHHRLEKWKQAIGLWTLELITLLLIGLLINLWMPTPQTAYAQSGTLVTLTHSTVADWNTCVVTNTNVSVANVSGGELRLAATLEDYFDGTEVNVTKWYSNVSNLGSGGTPTTSVSGGILALNGTYLLSNVSFTALPRFFESSSRLMQAPLTSGRPDLGYWRHPTLGPLYTPDASVGAVRLYSIDADPGNTTNFQTIYRDGLPDAVFHNVTDPLVEQNHLYRIEWSSAQSLFYVDGALWDTFNLPTNVITSWVFLYHQNPNIPSASTPTTVDWVRAGQYASSAEFVSCAIDGKGADWNSLWFTPTVPGSTVAQMSVRSSVDGTTWGAWATPSSTSPYSITSEGRVRYLQYRLQMSTSDPMQSPEVNAVTITRVTNPSAVTLSNVQARVEQEAFDWRLILVVATGIVVAGAFSLRRLHR